MLLTVACHHRTAQYVHFDAHKNAFVLAPALIRTGDSLYFVSYDTVLAAKYLVGSAESPAVAGAVAPLYGAVDISKLAAGIPETIRALAKGLASSDPEVASDVKSFVEEWSITRDPRPTPTVSDLQKLVEERTRLVTKLCDRSIRTATTWVLHHPSRGAYLRGIFDPAVRTLTTTIVDSNLAHSSPLASLLQRASDRLLIGDSDLQLADTLRSAGTRWSRRLAALLIAFGGPDALAVGQSDELVTHLTALAVCRREDAREVHPDLKQLNDTINKLWNVIRPPPVFTRWPSSRSITIADFGLDVMIDDAHSERQALDEHIKRLNKIAGLSARLETALASLPEFTARTLETLCAAAACESSQEELERVLTKTAKNRFAVPDTVLVGVYWGATRLVLTPERGQRYPKVVFSSASLAESGRGSGGGKGGGDSAGGEVTGAGSGRARVVTGASVGANAGKDANGKTASTPAEGQSPEPSQQNAGQNDKSKETAPPKSPYPAITIDVLEPSRFQLGVGFGRARLGGDEYSLEKDTVDGVAGTRVTRTGERPYANLPLLTLSYYVLPTRGKVFAAQAYDDHFLRNAGLAFTLGLALDAPLDRVFFGLSTEPAAGFNISLGIAAAYIEKADALGFVPTDVNASPVRKAWKRGAIPAWAISIDPAIAVSALGKLIGLK